MNCSRCSRWFQVGLAMLASSLTTAVHAATLEDYVDPAGMISSFTIADPVVPVALDPVENTTAEPMPEVEPVQAEIEPVQPAVQPSVELGPVDSVDKGLAPLVVGDELSEELLPEPVGSETTLPAEAMPTTRIFSADGEDVVVSGEENQLDETLEPLSENVSLTEEPLSASGSESIALPAEAGPRTRIFSARIFSGGEESVSEGNSDGAELSDGELRNFDAPVAQVEEVSIPEEALPTTITMSPGAIVPSSVRSEGVLIAQAVPNGVVPDTTLGVESSVVTPNVEIKGEDADLIEGGATRGSNLFHSFDEFSIGDNQRVYFANPVDIENILSRVTGGDRSNINGLLGVDGTANLFLLNPNGVLFGPNAELDIRGSFTASTADTYQFEGATAPVDIQGSDFLTMSVPMGVQRGIQQPQGDITNEGDLVVGDAAVDVGQSLTLFGNTVSSNGALAAPGRRVQLMGNQVKLSTNNDINVSAADINSTTLDVQNISTNEIDNLLKGTNNLILEADNNLNWNADATLNYEVTGADRTLELRANNNIIFLNNQNQTTGPRITPKEKSPNMTHSDTPLNVILNSDRDGSGTGRIRLGNTIINSNGGNILLGGGPNLGNVPLIPNSNAFAFGPISGIVLSNTRLISNGGDISLRGSGADKAGIRLANSSLIDSGNGRIFIEGQATAQAGESSAAVNIGFTSDSRITSDSFTPRGIASSNVSIISSNPNPDAITIVGRGPTEGDAANVAGVTIQLNSGVFSVGDGGGIRIEGTGGVGARGGASASVSRNHGIFLTGATGIGLTQNEDLRYSTIFTRSGPISLTGNRGGGSAAGIASGSPNNTRGAEAALTDARIGFLPDVLPVSIENSPTAMAYKLDSDDNQTTTGNITINTDASIFSINNEFTNLTIRTSNTGNITLNFSSDNARLSRTAIDNSVGPVNSSTGTITLNAKKGSLTLEDGTRISNEGNVSINVGDRFTIDNSIIQTEVRDAEDDLGNININAGELQLINGGVIDTATFGRGNAGDVQINIRDQVLVDGSSQVLDEEGHPIFRFSSILSRVNETGRGNAGNITIGKDSSPVGSVSITNGGFIDAAVFGQGNAGDISINTEDEISIFNRGRIYSRIEPGGVGEGGEINLQAESLSVSNGGFIDNSTLGQGNAGNVVTTISGPILLNNGQISSNVGFDVITNSSIKGAIGNGGNITINGESLSINNGGFIDNSTSGQGDAGNIYVNVRDQVLVNGSSQIFDNEGNPTLDNEGNPIYRLSSILSRVNETGRGNGGNITIRGESLYIQNGAFIDAAVFGQGNAGDVSINMTNSVTLDDGVIFSGIEPGGIGNAGIISIETPLLIIQDGGLTTSTFGSANKAQSDQVESYADSISTIAISANKIELSGNSGILANTFGSARGGNILLQSYASGGDIEINTIGDSAEISASTAPDSSGRGGNITIQNAEVARLENTELFTSSDGSGDAGGISVQNVGILLMRHDSLLQAGASNTGNGGDVDIDADFVVTVPGEDNDILANATFGNGGNINITANRIIGFQTPEEFSNNLSLRGNDRNDISARSQFKRDGQVSINNILVDPNQGLNELPETVEDSSDRIARGCRADLSGDSSTGNFAITGRSGQPLNPANIASDTSTLDDLGPVDAQAESSPSSPENTAVNTPPPVIEDAQKAIRTDSGEIRLVAQGSQHSSVSCSDLH